MEAELEKNNMNLDQLINIYDLYNIIRDVNYKNIYNAIFDITSHNTPNPKYHRLYMIYNALMLNLINNKFETNSDVQNKYFIKKLHDDNQYFYLVPINTIINTKSELQDIPIVDNVYIIDQVCKIDDKYTLCKIQIDETPKNFQVTNDEYYDNIKQYLTRLILIDIINKYNTKNSNNKIKIDVDIKSYKELLKATVPQLFTTTQ